MLIPRNNLCVSTYSAVERYSFAFQIKMQFIRKCMSPNKNAISCQCQQAVEGISDYLGICCQLPFKRNVKKIQSKSIGKKRHWRDFSPSMTSHISKRLRPFCKQAKGHFRQSKRLIYISCDCDFPIQFFIKKTQWLGRLAVARKSDFHWL
jgi:hypothetical protein